MRLIAVLTLLLFSATAVAGKVHKCQKRTGEVYFTDKSCSTKNQRDKPVLDKAAPSGEPAPTPQKKKKK